MEAIPIPWLEHQMPLQAIEAKLGESAAHPLWKRVKEQAQPGDEFWSFSTPDEMWMAKLGAAGYALVRRGAPLASFTIMRS
jgi:hypothetical protein